MGRHFGIFCLFWSALWYSELKTWLSFHTNLSLTFGFHYCKLYSLLIMHVCIVIWILSHSQKPYMTVVPCSTALVQGLRLVDESAELEIIVIGLLQVCSWFEVSGRFLHWPVNEILFVGNIRDCPTLSHKCWVLSWQFQIDWILTSFSWWVYLHLRIVEKWKVAG